jgi:predicted 3-demethylubiquinone-9 3-methyltransferase (glyoxalase superfamily)
MRQGAQPEKEDLMQKMIANLWFDDQAEEAAKFYTSIFKNSKILATTPYPKAAEEVSGKKAGSVMTVEFELDGDRFLALNGGPEFKFNESISFMVECEDQAEIDYYWDKLTEGGEESVCGWLKDRFGLSWQITPKALNDMMKDPDQEKVEAVTATFMKMKKLEVEPLRRAYENATVYA